MCYFVSTGIFLINHKVNKMINPKKQSTVDKAVTLAFNEVKKDGIKATDLFAVGTIFSVIGLVMLNTSWMPGSVKALGGFMVAMGLTVMVVIVRKF